MSKQDCKVFIGGLSWETTGEKLRQYFENFGTVREAFVSYNRNNGSPRGFGFVVFECPEVADKVVAAKHTIDRREVEAKKAVPKDEYSLDRPTNEPSAVKSRKIFIGGLSPSVDEKILHQYFDQFGLVEDAVVMYDHENKRPRGFGFVTFIQEESAEKVLQHGSVHYILEKQIEIKAAVPRDQMHTSSGRGYHAQVQALPQQHTGSRPVIHQYVSNSSHSHLNVPAVRSNSTASIISANIPSSSISSVLPIYSRPMPLNSATLTSTASSYDVYGDSYALRTAPEVLTNSHSLYHLAASLPKSVHSVQAAYASSPQTIDKQINALSKGFSLNAFGGITGSIANGYQLDEQLYSRHERNASMRLDSELTHEAVSSSLPARFGAYPGGNFSSIPAPG